MLKKIINLFKISFDCKYLFGTDDIHSTKTKNDEPLDCKGFYLSNTETNYGKSRFQRYK